MLVCSGILGLLVGSFLNVVILRLPRMLENTWQRSAAALLGQPLPDRQPYDLSRPRSACPHCHTPLRPWHNIPLISFCLLRGRCAVCDNRISRQYPAVELTAAVLAVLVVWHFGITPAAVLALLLSWSLLTLAVIDWQTQLLPDHITLPMLWLGLLASPWHVFVAPTDAIIGAAAGYLVLWFVFHAFRLMTGKEGMGYGDFKLLAVLGAWLGWQQLPMVLLLASSSGAVIGIVMLATGRLQRGQPMPFGPFLAGAGWLTLISGDTMLQFYFSLTGL